MSLTRLRLGYVPLIDAAPLIVGAEIGFAAEEGLEFDLVRLRSWAQSRDMLGTGGVDAAHMLVPLPIAQTLGLGPDYPAFDLVMFISQGGQAIAVNAALADRLRGIGPRLRLRRRRGGAGRAGAGGHGAAAGGRAVPVLDAGASGAALAGRLGAGGRAVDPHRPAAHDGRRAGRRRGGRLLRGRALGLLRGGNRGRLAAAARAARSGRAPPEKGLVLTRAFTEGQPALTGALMRAIWRACRWLDDPQNRGTAVEILSRPEYLNLSPELSERGLLGRLHVSPQGEVRHFPDFIRFHAGGANFPWRSTAALLARGIAEAHGLDPLAAMQAASACFRTDLYRQHLRAAGADMPGASARIEGAMAHPTPVASEKGQMILGPDAFFDGETFDPPIYPR